MILESGLLTNSHTHTGETLFSCYSSTLDLLLMSGKRKSKHTCDNTISQGNCKNINLQPVDRYAVEGCHMGRFGYQCGNSFGGWLIVC